MLLSLVTGALALGLLQQADTTFPVQRGQRLQVHAHTGSIAVTAWNRDAVRVVAESDQRVELDVDAGGGTIRVDATRGRWGGPADVAYRISAPAWMPLALDGVNTDITVTGIQAPVSAETVNGEVHVRGGEGLIRLHSVEGAVTLEGATGTMEVGSVNDDVRVTDSRGALAADGVNGDIALLGIASDNVAATTVNGDVTYDGRVEARGRYHLESHNGDLVFSVGENASATVTVNTFNGDFEADFPVTLQGGRQGKRFTFTIGGGSAGIQLDSFQGDIRLVRSGAARARDR